MKKLLLILLLSLGFIGITSAGEVPVYDCSNAPHGSIYPGTCWGDSAYQCSPQDSFYEQIQSLPSAGTSGEQGTPYIDGGKEAYELYIKLCNQPSDELEPVKIEGEQKTIDSREIVDNNIQKLKESNACQDCNLTGADLRRADLSKADLRRADLREAYLHGANLREADLHGADLREAELNGADLSKANLTGADLRRADLSKADLWDSDLNGADLSKANLREADLHGADLREAELNGADLSKANLTGADLRRADLSKADLHGADLRGANLSKAALREADLYGADLREADLSKADLWGSDLHGADLRGADLRGVVLRYLSGANLTGANLTGADLSNANFNGANLEEAAFTGKELFHLAKQTKIYLVIALLAVLIFTIYVVKIKRFSFKEFALKPRKLANTFWLSFKAFALKPRKLANTFWLSFKAFALKPRKLANTFWLWGVLYPWLFVVFSVQVPENSSVLSLYIVGFFDGNWLHENEDYIFSFFITLFTIEVFFALFLTFRASKSIGMGSFQLMGIAQLLVSIFPLFFIYFLIAMGDV
jgi:uncharacterized protein YjbI with pentapeptide repeats